MTNQLVELAQITSGTLISISGIWGLIYYRIHKKFKAERHKGILAFVESSWVELVITAVVVPN